MNMSVTLQSTQRMASCQASFIAQISQKLPRMDQTIREIVAATFLININNPKKFQIEIINLENLDEEAKNAIIEISQKIFFPSQSIHQPKEITKNKELKPKNLFEEFLMSGNNALKNQKEEAGLLKTLQAQYSTLETLLNEKGAIQAFKEDPVLKDYLAFLTSLLSHQNPKIVELACQSLGQLLLIKECCHLFLANHGIHKMTNVIEKFANDYLLVSSEKKLEEDNSLQQLEKVIILSSLCIYNCARHYDPSSLQMMSAFSPGIIRSISRIWISLLNCGSSLLSQKVALFLSQLTNKNPSSMRKFVLPLDNKSCIIKPLFELLKNGDEKSILAALKCLYELPCTEALQNYLYFRIDSDDESDVLTENGLDSIIPLLHRNEKIVKGALLCLAKWIQAESSIEEEQLEEFYEDNLGILKPTLVLPRLIFLNELLKDFTRNPEKYSTSEELTLRIVENEKEKIITFLTNENPKVAALACDCLMQLIKMGMINENEENEVVNKLRSLLENDRLVEKARNCLFAIDDMYLNRKDEDSRLHYIQRLSLFFFHSHDKSVEIALHRLHATATEQCFKDTWQTHNTGNLINEVLVVFLANKNKDIVLAAIKLLEKISLFSVGSPNFSQVAIERLLPYIKEEGNKIQLPAIECLVNLSRVHPHTAADCIDLPLFFNLLKDEKAPSSVKEGIARVLAALCCSPNYRQLLLTNLEKGLITLEKESIHSMLLRKIPGSVVLFEALLLDDKQTLTRQEKKQITQLLHSRFKILTSGDQEHAILVLHKLITSQEEFLDKTAKKNILNSLNQYLIANYLVDEKRLLELSNQQKLDIGKLFNFYPWKPTDRDRENAIADLFQILNTISEKKKAIADSFHLLDPKYLSFEAGQKELIKVSLDNYLRDNMTFDEQSIAELTEKQKHEVVQLFHVHCNYQLSDNEKDDIFDALDYYQVDREKNIAHQWMNGSLKTKKYKKFIPYLNLYLTADYLENILLESEKINKKALFVCILEMFSLLQDQSSVQKKETLKPLNPLFDFSQWYNPNQMMVHSNGTKRKRGQVEDEPIEDMNKRQRLKESSKKREGNPLGNEKVKIRRLNDGEAEDIEDGDVAFVQDGSNEPQIHVQENLFSDVTFYIGDQQFSCHQLVLLQSSSYFEQLFVHNRKENEEMKIVIKEVDPVIFNKVITFCYSQKFDFHEVAIQDVMQVLEMANRFAIEKLEDLCCEFLMSKISLETAEDMIAFASHRSSSKKFTNDVMHWLMKNYSSLSDPLKGYIAENWVSFYQEYFAKSKTTA